MELTISKERVLEAASKCTTAKRTLEIMFPEAFEEQVRYFRSGTIFQIKQRFFESLGDFKGAEPSAYNGCIKHSSPSFVAKIGESSITSNKLVLLMHEKNAHEYRLIHVATGYSWSPKKTYYRKSKGIEIPVADLEYLDPVFTGSGK